jgi:choline transport protein
MVGANIIFLQTSCVIPQAILLYRGRDKVLPKRHFSLGRYGAFINATAVLWVVALDVIYFIPTLQPVTVTNMNYVSVVTAGIVTFILVLWFTTKRNSFKGPAVDMELIRMRREEALHQDEVVLVAENSAKMAGKSSNE